MSLLGDNPEEVQAELTHSGWVTQRCQPGSGEFRHHCCVLCVIPAGWGAPLGSEPGRVSSWKGWESRGDVLVLSEGVWGSTGNNILEHPDPAASSSAPGYPPWGSSTDAPASCKVILYFIASFLP